MKRDIFITEDFLLETKQARRLYHEYAEGLPIIDFHSHLPPDQIAEDRRFRNIAEIWLGADHYKWRLMRTNGVSERFCTGDASDWEKFQKWAETVPHVLRNPLYHWTHLELKRYFGISDRLLSPRTAKGIWSECNRKLAGPGFSCRDLLKRGNVVLLCTTDDPTDSLVHHKAIAKDETFAVRVVPTWRPDNAMLIGDPERFNSWTDKLAAASDVDIRGYSSFMKALRNRHDFFHETGCRVSDHGLETIYAEACTERQAKAIFDKARAGRPPGADEVLKFKSHMLYEFGVMDADKGWVQQYHLGALRDNNTRMFKALGPNAGFDSIGDFGIARPLSRLLDRLNTAGKLAKTILYNLNPRDNALLAAMIGNFQDGSAPGKMQFGSGWWFLDQKHGMEDQMETLSQMGLLSRFVGMVTDSRSFLSFARHEYFRRVLCNMLGNDMARGLIPGDMAMAGGLVRDVCCNNAASYFGFGMEESAAAAKRARKIS